jgi:colanic acid/amylovoran biosynthesis glycosyltransferase
MGGTPIMYVLKRFPRLSETFVLRELLALEATGARISIDVLLRPEPGVRHPELAALRASVRYLPRHPRLREGAVAAAHLRVAVRSPLTWIRLAIRAKRADIWRRFLQAGLVAQRVRSEGATHIHAHFATAAAEVARDAAALAGVPFTVTTHAKDIFQHDHLPLLAERLEGVATAVAISEFNARYLRERLPGIRVRHIPNGIPLAPLRSARSDGPVLCVARLIPKKGVDVLIEATALLASDRPRLVVEVVGDGELAAELAQLAVRLGVADRVRFLGPVSSREVAAALERCSLVAAPCRVAADGDRDGIPTVLLEAMARGLSVVSTRVTGIPEVVRDGETGLLVPPDDPAALAEAIARLLDDSDLAEELGGRARSLVAKRFDANRSARMLRDLFAGSAS